MPRPQLTLQQIQALKRYSVLLTRDVTESVTVYVLANSKEDALDAALEEARECCLEWKVDDNTPPDPYIGDCLEENVKEITGKGPTDE